MNTELLRTLPKVDELLQDPQLKALCPELTRNRLAEAIREEIGFLREGVLRGEIAALPAREEILLSAVRRAQLSARPSLRPVYNGTGVTLHTNLGRACLSKKAVEAVKNVAAQYSTLEYDVQQGKRGQRYSHVEALLQRLTGAEAAFVVNNNAAAVLLLLSALTQGGEVVVSRGELVEIGGSFRVPDIMESCGARLKEVGTTNKTKISDYEKAINDNTKALMKVHTSNYRLIGFTESVDREAMCRLGHGKGLPVLEDIGSGSLLSLAPLGILDEPTVQDSIKAGMDVVSFSGDKLLGGPQAGILVGKKEYIELCRKHPLARALRVDKMTLAALEATLRSYEEERAIEEIPTMEALFMPIERIKYKAETLSCLLKQAGIDSQLLAVEDQVGGGSVPMQLLPGYALALCTGQKSVVEAEAALRRHEPSLIGRIDHDRYLLHLRTLREEDFHELVSLISEVLL